MLDVTVSLKKLREYDLVELWKGKRGEGLIPFPAMPSSLSFKFFKLHVKWIGFWRKHNIYEARNFSIKQLIRAMVSFGILIQIIFVIQVMGYLFLKETGGVLVFPAFAYLYIVAILVTTIFFLYKSAKESEKASLIGYQLEELLRDPEMPKHQIWVPSNWRLIFLLTSAVDRNGERYDNFEKIRTAKKWIGVGMNKLLLRKLEDSMQGLLQYNQRTGKIKWEGIRFKVTGNMTNFEKKDLEEKLGYALKARICTAYLNKVTRAPVYPAKKL